MELESYKETREVEVLDAPDKKKTREWQAIRDECVDKDDITEDSKCNLVATGFGKAELEIISKTLSCGCILVPSDSEDIYL